MQQPEYLEFCRSLRLQTCDRLHDLHCLSYMFLNKCNSSASMSAHAGQANPLMQLIRVCTLTCADTLLDNLTVREMLLYTAELKNPSSQSFEDKAARVDAVLTRLALWCCRNVRIGSPLKRGVSGQRLSISSQSRIAAFLSQADD